MEIFYYRISIVSYIVHWFQSFLAKIVHWNIEQIQKHWHVVFALQCFCFISRFSATIQMICKTNKFRYKVFAFLLAVQRRKTLDKIRLLKKFELISDYHIWLTSAKKWQESLVTFAQLAKVATYVVANKTHLSHNRLCPFAPLFLAYCLKNEKTWRHSLQYGMLQKKTKFKFFSALCVVLAFKSRHRRRRPRLPLNWWHNKRLWNFQLQLQLLPA